MFSYEPHYGLWFITAFLHSYTDEIVLPFLMSFRLLSFIFEVCLFTLATEVFSVKGAFRFTTMWACVTLEHNLTYLTEITTPSLTVTVAYHL